MLKIRLVKCAIGIHEFLMILIQPLDTWNDKIVAKYISDELLKVINNSWNVWEFHFNFSLKVNSLN